MIMFGLLLSFEAAATEHDPAALLRVFAPGQGTAPHEQAWFQFNTAGHTAPVRGLRFSQNGRSLYSVGEDKVVRCWNLLEQQETRCIRWRVGRENWGTIYVVAQYGDTLAFAGQAANTWMQEIWIADTNTGDYRTILRPDGPGNCVIALIFLGSENRLASLQNDGTVEIWEKQGNDWKKTATPRRSDEITVAASLPPGSEERLRAIETMVNERRLKTLAFFGQRYLVYPVFKKADVRRNRFNLAFYDLETRRQYANPFELNGIAALATDAKGETLLLIDMENQIFEWTPATREQPPRLVQKLPAVRNPDSLAVSGNGTRFVIGTLRNAGENSDSPAYLLRWTRSAADTRQWTPATTIALPSSVVACDLNADGSQIACAQGNSVVVLDWNSPESKYLTLGSGTQPIDQVAFAADTSYRIMWSKKTEPGERLQTIETFDPKDMQMDTRDSLDRREWQSLYGLNTSGSWSLRLSEAGGTPRYLIFRAGESREYSSLQLEPTLHPPLSIDNIQTINQTTRIGTVVGSVYWLTDNAGRATHLILGTSGVSRDIFVFRIAQGTSPIVRRFRGHSGAAVSLSVSSDRRYLVSAALDETIRFWNLQGLTGESPTEQRWGMKLKQQGNTIVVETIAEESPLFIRGVRVGSRLKRIMVSDTVQGARQARYIDEPREMLARIADAPWDSQIGYEFENAEGALPSFAVSPTRREVAAFAAFAGTTDFAFWSPFGYYTASADGSRCFGWLYNRGLRGIPEFVMADSFRNTLENRPLMMRLLDAGTLEKAMAELDRAKHDYSEAVAHASLPPPPSPPKPDEILVPLPPPPPPVVVTPPPPPPKPTYDALRVDKQGIEILLPKTREELASNTIHIEARACFPSNETPLPPKLFANGIWAGLPNQTVDESQADVPSLRFVRYVWNAVRLPADPYVQVKVSLESAKGTFTASDSKIAIRQNVAPPPRPKMYLVLLGTDYMDIRNTFPELPGVKGTIEKVLETVQNTSGLMYDVEVFPFVNEKATLVNWRAFVKDFTDNRAASIQPDDLFVTYIAGHGALDIKTGKYFYAMYETKYEEYSKHDFTGSWGFDEILPFAVLPCRRVVILETCQFMENELEDPNKDYRRLEDEQFLLLLAAEPGKSAIWTDNNTIGRFSKFLIEGWNGAADGFNPLRGRDGAVVEADKDGKVTLAENYNFLELRLRRFAHQQSQRAEVFGKDLLRIIDIPISEHADCPEPTRGVRTIVVPRRPLGNIAELSAQ